MSKLSIVVFCLAVVAQTIRAQPLGVDTPAVFNGAEDTLDHGDEDYSEEDTTMEEFLSEEVTDEDLDAAVHEILSRTRRGLRSRLKRAWKKHIRPAVQAAVTAHVVKAVVPVIAAGR
ncbi:hypothetical protein FHG87_000002 [Trinorchestia longiramus]|nr:hypothetical protein FHG87_000002 [Trinorchestia longiramus]